VEVPWWWPHLCPDERGVQHWPELLQGWSHGHYLVTQSNPGHFITCWKEAALHLGTWTSHLCGLCCCLSSSRGCRRLREFEKVKFSSISRAQTFHRKPLALPRLSMLSLLHFIFWILSLSLLELVLWSCEHYAPSWALPLNLPLFRVLFLSQFFSTASRTVSRTKLQKMGAAIPLLMPWRVLEDCWTPGVYRGQQYVLWCSFTVFCCTVQLALPPWPHNWRQSWSTWPMWWMRVVFLVVSGICGNQAFPEMPRLSSIA